MPEYLPQNYRYAAIETGDLVTASKGVAVTTIVRGARIEGISSDRNRRALLFQFAGLPQPLSIAADRRLCFGDECVTASEYVRRVVERNDLLDIIFEPSDPGQIANLWIQIRYVGRPLPDQTFSRKDDGLFALRTKAGEKAERIVTRLLASEYGHSYPGNQIDSPGFFEIRYADKKRREPDRRCGLCGLRVEIKKRNKDRRYRISHSEGRPFWTENDERGWHAFVFPDMSHHFVSNATILQALRSGRFRIGRDRYDAYADLDDAFVTESVPPMCPGLTQPSKSNR